MDTVKAISYYYKKGSSEGYDKPTLDAMYAKAREKYPNLEIVEYLCDNNKSFTEYYRAVELVADHGIRCVLIPGLGEASYDAVDSFNNIDFLLQIAEGVEIFCAEGNIFYTEEARSVLKVLTDFVENKRALHQYNRLNKKKAYQ